MRSNHDELFLCASKLVFLIPLIIIRCFVLSARKNKEVTRVLTDLSLTGCCKNRVGNVDRRGISGGERKRVSIGCELLVNPSVLFVDEPTSGLDSKTAEDVVMTLKKLAQEGRTLICTIHQPSYKLLQVTTFKHLLD